MEGLALNYGALAGRTFACGGDGDGNTFATGGEIWREPSSMKRGLWWVCS